MRGAGEYVSQHEARCGRSSVIQGVEQHQLGDILALRPRVGEAEARESREPHGVRVSRAGAKWSVSSVTGSCRLFAPSPTLRPVEHRELRVIPEAYEAERRGGRGPCS